MHWKSFTVEKPFSQLKHKIQDTYFFDNLKTWSQKEYFSLQRKCGGHNSKVIGRWKEITHIGYMIMILLAMIPQDLPLFLAKLLCQSEDGETSIYRELWVLILRVSWPNSENIHLLQGWKKEYFPYSNSKDQAERMKTIHRNSFSDPKKISGENWPHM